MRKVITGIVIAVFVIGAIGGGYFLFRSFGGSKATLTVWTLSGTESGIKAVADYFSKTHKGVKITVVPVPESVYEFRFLYALASQKSVDGIPPPDVLVLPNETMALHRSKLVAAPEGVIDKAIQSYQATPKPNQTPQSVTKGRANSEIIKQDYSPAAVTDTATGTTVWSIPLNSDTLAMFYNKSLIAIPPKTWEEVADVAKKVTQKSGQTINRSAVALGNSSVDHALDIVSILMLQNGTAMTKNESTAGFNLSTPSGIHPGANALDFFTSFAKSSKETYSWNTPFGSSLLALKTGKTALAFGYMSDALGLPGTISVAPLPQVDPNSAKTYGRYLTIGVTKNAVDPKLGWQFASHFANPDLAQTYARATKTIPARFDAAKQFGDNRQKVFVDQVPLAVTWSKKEVGVADGALGEALNLAVGGDTSASTALDVAAKAYTTFLQADSGIPSDPAFLSLWQSSDDTTNYRVAIQNFLADHKDVGRVVVSKREAKRFEWELLNVLAARLGPDIAAVPSRLVGRLHQTLKSFPAGTFKPSSFKASDGELLQKLFAPAVANDNYIDGKLYGMPPSIETLYLAYDRKRFQDLDRDRNSNEDQDYLDNSGLFADGPTTWDDLATMAKIATKRDGANLNQPFLALGTGSNVQHASDIYAAFVMQAGGEVNNPDRLRSGIQLPISSSDNRVPGQEAYDFIVSFSDPKQENYTWNKDQPNSLEALATGKTMVAFIYPRDIAIIEKLNPGIELRFFPLPQIDDASAPLDFAASASLTVPKSSPHSQTAGQFVVTAVKQGQESGFVAPTKTEDIPKTTDRAGISEIQRFQANTAQTFFRGNYPDDIDVILNNLLDKKISLDQAATRLNQFLPKAIFGR